MAKQPEGVVSSKTQNGFQYVFGYGIQDEERRIDNMKDVEIQ